MRFILSGSIGNVLFFFIERIVYFFLRSVNGVDNLHGGSFMKQNINNLSFFFGYLIQIATQHYVHAVLVYGLETIDTKQKYFSTLRGQYVAYSFALFGSTALNMLLLNWGFHKNAAFVSTMSIFACINYFVCGWIVKRAVKSSTK